jgi:hypothetical protein
MKEIDMDDEIKDNKLADLTPYQLKFIDEYMKCGNKHGTLISFTTKLNNLSKVKVIKSI